jgi:hypothetical protein
MANEITWPVEFFVTRRATPLIENSSKNKMSAIIDASDMSVQMVYSLESFRAIVGRTYIACRRVSWNDTLRRD